MKKPTKPIASKWCDDGIGPYVDGEIDMFDEMDKWHNHATQPIDNLFEQCGNSIEFIMSQWKKEYSSIPRDFQSLQYKVYKALLEYKKRSEEN